MVVTPSKDDLEDRMIYDSFMSELLDKMPRGDLPTPLRDFPNRVIAFVGAESFGELETRNSLWDPLLEDMHNFPLRSVERTALEDTIEKIEPSPYSKTLWSICLKSDFPLENVRFYAEWSDFHNDSSCNPDIIFFDGHGYSVEYSPLFDEPHISCGYEAEAIGEETRPIGDILRWINEKKGSIFLIFLPICCSIELAKVLQSDKVKHVFGPDGHSITQEETNYRLESILLLFDEWFA
jgi:hypothetical protein